MIGTSINGCTAEDSVLVTIIPVNLVEAVHDQYTVTSNESTVLDVSSNDINPNSSMTIIEPPMNGDAVVNTDGTITYTSDLGYAGPDVFLSTICAMHSDCSCDTASVNIDRD